MSATKKYDSTVSFHGKKRGDIEYAAKNWFFDSFLWIKVDHDKAKFVVFVSDKAEPDKITQFEKEFCRQCKIKIFKEISLDDLRNPFRPIAAH